MELVGLAMELAGRGQIAWWRGHPDSSWKLVPAVFRSEERARKEAQLAMGFVSKAVSRHSSCPPTSDTSAWLFLMQHYGLPTRLLDWTESALAAAFFAACEHPERPGRVWGLLPGELNRSQGGEPSIPLPGHPSVARIMEQITSPTPGQNTPTIALLPLENDVRMMMQSAAFTIHGSQTPLEEIAGAESFLIAIDIPTGSKPNFIRELRTLGTRRATLFPDLNNLARDLVENLGL
jgi:FRG domain-containing protein